MKEIDKYLLDDYYKETLVDRRFLYFWKYSINDIMKWQSSIIKTPLSKLNKEIEKKGVQIFKSK